ncbi:DUF5703 domain-containing protein [Paenibacillus sp. YIM B09110]|uniref:DUF5703 domain-containing protein n=1 Tax=Paenibacillus sp. YIM B09110 TaxID=3126102 RepID=UPI00301DCFF4
MTIQPFFRDYDIEWNMESKNSSDSMPLGGGDIGLNVWVQEHEIMFYAGRSGALDENNQLLKLGRFRIRLIPNPFQGCDTFRQTLRLEEGTVEIEAVHSEHGRVQARLWVEVHEPRVHVEIDSEQPLTVEACYESWRTDRREVTDRDPCSSLIDYPGEVYTSPDSVTAEGNEIWFYHLNDNERLVTDLEIELQQLGEHKRRIYDPLRDFIFGGRMSGEGFVFSGTQQGQYEGIQYVQWALASASPGISHRLNLFLHQGRYENPEGWQQRMIQAIAEAVNPERAWRRNEEWWRNFWERSYIAIGADKKDENNPVWQVGRNYQLFRFMLACNAYGSDPTKFNGGLFSFDPKHVHPKYEDETPDFRRWGGGTFTAQNQRLVYWPMLKSGDFDMMTPQFEFYRRALPTAECRSEVYWGHKGAAFAEQLNNTGLPSSREYGWNRSEQCEPGVEDSEYVSYQYVHQLDFSFMILQYYHFSGQDIGEYMPFVESSLRFFYEHYQFRSIQMTGRPFDENGYLAIYPSTACETFRNARNPSDVISGLLAVLHSLLELPDAIAGPSKKREWLEMLDRIPPLAFEEKEGKRTIAPAVSWSHVQNQEIPQLYPLFPFGLFGIGRPELHTARNTWNYSLYHDNQKSHVSWHQGGIFTAGLGLSKEASEYAVKKLADGNHRFPAFWGPGHDWTPDHNWGGTGMIGLQEMLLQTDGNRIYLLPAWPENWDVKFKLHAPMNTIVECEYRDGQLQSLIVTPEYRSKDIVRMKRKKGEFE